MNDLPDIDPRAWNLTIALVRREAAEREVEERSGRVAHPLGEGPSSVQMGRVVDFLAKVDPQQTGQRMENALLAAEVMERIFRDMGKLPKLSARKKFEWMESTRHARCCLKLLALLNLHGLPECWPRSVREALASNIEEGAYIHHLLHRYGLFRNPDQAARFFP